MIIVACYRIHKVASLRPPYLFLLCEEIPAGYCTCLHLIGQERMQIVKCEGARKMLDPNIVKLRLESNCTSFKNSKPVATFTLHCKHHQLLFY